MSPGDDFKAADKFDIQVALKIIRHISSGIYRDRAGALRELISNSFDAQATTVRITTDPPRHNTIVVSDNGLGIDSKTLRTAFTQVGLSLKVTNPELYKSDLDRPLIGRFGIGFLAAAHISRDIWIRSFKKDQKVGVEVHIDLKPYFLYQDEVKTLDEFKFGTVEYREIEDANAKHGTRVELRNVRSGPFHAILTRTGERLVRWPAPGLQERVPGTQMQRLVELSQRRVNMLFADRFQGREEIFWHLGMTTPVKYLDDGPVRAKYLHGTAETAIKELRKYNEDLKFTLWFDGLEVRKPLLLPTHKVGAQEPEDPTLPEDVLVSVVEVDGKSARGRPVKATGYLFYQPWRIVPAELRGLYPRMGGVGIGYTFENRFLAYLKGESPILRVQVSGELYIEGGMDEALNLDRSGFMELDPEYTFLAEAAGKQVREFFTRAKSTHASAYAKKKRTTDAQKREAAIVTLREFAKSLGDNLKVDVIDSLDPSSLNLDFDKVALYSLGEGADLVVDLERNRVIIGNSEFTSPVGAEIILAVDRILRDFAREPIKARTALAKQLERILTESED